MMSDGLVTLILAAGKGTRMKSSTPKMLHKLGGKPMLGYVLDAVEALKPDHAGIVLGREMPDVETYVRGHSLSPSVFYQESPHGTGHAVLCAEPFLKDFPGKVLVLLGDAPLVRPETLQNVLKAYEAFSTRPAVMVVGMTPLDPKNYGRLVVDEAGGLREIVETRGASADILSLPLCHSGVMVLDGRHALALLKSIQKNKESGEYYVTDIVRIAQEKGFEPVVYRAEEATEFEGVNSRQELAEAEECLQGRWRQHVMEKGVTLLDPKSVYLSYDTILAPDVTVYPYVFFGPGVQVESGVEIKPFTHLEGVHIKARAKIGPYARLRPGTLIEEEACVGNFVEMKNTRFGPGSKASHLSYVGDAVVGKKTNIGAGVITCNYDGYTKWQTEIGAQVLVGANSALVAPLSIGDGAVVGAGSVITKDVSSDSLAVSRGAQREIPGGGKAYHQAKKKRRSIRDKE